MCSLARERLWVETVIRQYCFYAILRTIRRECSDELTINQGSEVKWKMRTAAPPRGIKQLRQTTGHDASLDYRSRLVCQLLH